MNVYTSYFNNAEYLQHHNIIAVGISRFPPDKFKDNNIYLVAPAEQLLSDYKNWKVNKDQYKSIYINQLRNTNIDEICKAIEKVSEENDNKDVALCCYEQPGEFCHRHILAEWLNDFNLFGGNIHEITAKDFISNDSIELF